MSDGEEIAARLLVEWRDAREVIFKEEQPLPASFTRLGAAELALMNYARGIPAALIERLTQETKPKTTDG